MKKIFLGLLIFISNSIVKAQNGLENIIVEKYYVSDLNDATMNSTGGILPVGSVTYRIYVDMLPGYRFQAVYGVPGHEMRIETSTLFFNNEDRGATSPTYSKTQASHNTVMLDSWLSVGAACAGNFGVLKSEDNGVSTVLNTDMILLNADTSAGIPLAMEDGMVMGSPEPVTTVGISNEIAVFDNQNDGSNGPLFSTFNGSWASLNGSTGPDSLENKVLIAQITTDGSFSFELNIQIGTPVGGNVEQYVARNPIGNETLFPQLVFNSASTSNIEAGVVRNNDLKVFPNPAGNKISINYVANKVHTETGSYSIFDGKGRKIIQKNLGIVPPGFLEDINLLNFASGLYSIEFLLGSEIIHKTFIKN